MDDMDADTQTRKRPWADLPPELLSLIADRLALIELLRFGVVCKGWRSASSTSSALIESAIGTEPSFLVYGNNEKFDFYYKTGEKKYSISSIPEVENATCLASNYGWLLLFQEGSMFFFCPFSRARIQLPQFPHSGLSDHIAAFSAPPTSPDCILCVANKCLDSSKVELHLLRRGASEWTKHEKYDPLLESITGAYYHREYSCFYFMDDNKNLLEFSVKIANWQSYKIVYKSDSSVGILPFAYIEDYFTISDMKTLMELQDHVSISTCGTTFFQETGAFLVNNEILNPPSGTTASAQLKGIWIHPRILRISSNQSWSL